MMHKGVRSLLVMLCGVLLLATPVIQSGDRAQLLAQSGNVKLNHNLINGADVQDGYTISPDGSRVVYLAREGSRTNLYSVPVGGGTAVRLNAQLPDNRFVSAYKISPNSQRVVYLANQERFDSVEMYSVPITGGGNVTKLNPLLPDGSDVSVFDITPNSQRVIYIANASTNSKREIYSVTILGGNSIKLNETPVAGGDVAQFEISPNGLFVVYSGDIEINNQFDLYRAPIAGGPVSQMTEMREFGDFGYSVVDFVITDDNDTVVFLANEDTFFDRDELFSVPFLAGPGGPVTKLSNTPPEFGDVAPDWQVTPSSDGVVYRADMVTDNIFELYAVPIAANAVVKLSDPLVQGGSVSGFSISPNSLNTVYRADQDTDNVTELYSVTLNGVTKLNAPLSGGGNVTDHKITPNSQRVIYNAFQFSPLQYGLYSVPITGGTATLLNNPPVQNRSIRDFQITLNGNTVVYSVQADNIYRVPVTGGSAPVQMNGNLVSGGGIQNFQLSPDGTRVVYLADQDTDNVFELYSVAIDGAVSLAQFDVNGDGIISPADSIEVINRIGQTVNDGNRAADVDGNGSINNIDANLVIQRIGQRVN